MNLHPINEESFELVAELSNRKFKTIIDQKFYDCDECAPTLKLHRSILRTVLETHIHDEDFFEFQEGTSELIVSFAINLGYGVKEKVVLRLEEEIEDEPIIVAKRKICEMEKKMEEIKGEMEKIKMEIEIRDELLSNTNKMNWDGTTELITGLEERMERMEDDNDKVYVLDHVPYTDADDKFVMDFKWELANQAERDRFIMVTKKYFVGGSYGLGEIPKYAQITRVEPLCLKVSGKVVHIWGWYDVKKWRNDGIEIPEEAGVESVVPRILQHVSNKKMISTGHGNAYAYEHEGILMLYKNRLSIVGPMMDRFHSGLNELHNHHSVSNLDNTDNKVAITRNGYIIIDTWFYI